MLSFVLLSGASAQSVNATSGTASAVPPVFSFGSTSVGSAVAPTASASTTGSVYVSDGVTYTVTNTDYYTITSCSDHECHRSHTSTFTNATVTEETTIFTTVCDEPTTFTVGGTTYTVTAPTTITITECPETTTASTTAPTEAPVETSSASVSKSAGISTTGAVPSNTIAPQPSLNGTTAPPVVNAAPAVKVGAVAGVLGAVALML